MTRNAAISLAIIAALVITICMPNTTISYAATSQEKNNQKVIAHGGGAYQGYETTNSVEAINHAISNGYQLIELDMEISSDQKIIMLHDWDRTAFHYFGTNFSTRITENQFLNLSIHSKLEVLTFDRLVKILDSAPNIKIVTDTKGDNVNLLTLIANNYPNYIGRIIPQIYDYGQLNQVKELGYTDIIFTLYNQAKVDIERLIDFVKENNLYAVTMPDYYAEKGICKSLSQSGITVYVHPVGTLEKAINFKQQGAYGVYSGTLLPEELEGIEKDYYLAAADESGKLVKLTDEYMNELRQIQMKGLKAGQSVKYFVDDTQVASLTKEGLITCQEGKHKLAVKIYETNGNSIGQIEYFLWKEENNIRVLHKKYEYRLEAMKETKDFNSVMDTNVVPKDIREILEKSFIAKKGEYHFYNNGAMGKFMNGDEVLPVQKKVLGNLLLPLGSTALELGATSVEMEKGRDLVITYGNEKNRIIIDSYCIRNGFRVTRIKTPISLYLNKAMASGEIYEYLTGRKYIEKNDLIIILPIETKLDKDTENQIVKAAQGLLT